MVKRPAVLRKRPARSLQAARPLLDAIGVYAKTKDRHGQMMARVVVWAEARALRALLDSPPIDMAEGETLAAEFYGSPPVEQPAEVLEHGPRVVEWGLSSAVPPEWVVTAALDLFFATDVNDQVIAVEAVAFGTVRAPQGES